MPCRQKKKIVFLVIHFPCVGPSTAVNSFSVFPPQTTRRRWYTSCKSNGKCSVFPAFRRRGKRFDVETRRTDRVNVVLLTRTGGRRTQQLLKSNRFRFENAKGTRKNKWMKNCSHFVLGAFRTVYYDAAHVCWAPLVIFGTGTKKKKKKRTIKKK